MFRRRKQLLLTATVIGAAVLAVGCESQPQVEQRLMLFPAPPATPRVQFLTWASGAQQVEAARSGFADFVLGEEPIAQLALDKPYGVAARDGSVYVCDSKGLSLARLDFKNKTYSLLGTSGPGRLRKPINVVIDELGYKFVTDPVRRQVVVFGPDDKYTTAFDIPQPSRPVDVAIWESELYILDNDPKTCRILVLDRQTGEILRTFGGPGPEPGQFKIPSSICFSPDGYLYVSDTLNWRVQKLTRDGESVWAKGAPGYRLGQFGRPRGLRVGPDGIVYVADAATEIIQMFNPDGEILMHFGGPGAVPGALVLPATVAVDKTSLPYFQEYIHPDFNAEYLLFASSQYGRHLISVYAFGSFPEGYKLSESQIATLPRVSPEEAIGPVTGPMPPPDATGQPADQPQAPEQD